MNNAIEIEIQVIEFYIVWIWACDIDWDCDSIDFFWRFFDGSRDYLGIFSTEPAKCRWNTTINFLYKYIKEGWIIPHFKRGLLTEVSGNISSDT